MRYVPKHLESDARRVVNLQSCGNVHRSGNVTGMQRKFPSWERGGQVRIGSYIYNVGREGVARLQSAGLVEG